MTANQLQFQRNLISEQEANERIRANKAEEALRAKELAQNKTLTQEQHSIQERENFAKYGSYAYLSPEEKRGGVREVFDLVRRGFEYVLNPVLAILTGGK